MLEGNIQTERDRETEDVLQDKKIQCADKWANVSNVLHPVHDTQKEMRWLTDSCRLFHCTFQCAYPSAKTSILKSYPIGTGCKSSVILSFGTVQFHVPSALTTRKELVSFHWIWRWIGCIRYWWFGEEKKKLLALRGVERYLFRPGVILCGKDYLLFSI